MNRAYPISLDLAGQPCLVVGGGAVAARKVEGLLAAAARVTLVAPRVCEAVGGRVREGRVAWRARPFAPADLDGTRLAFVATSDREVNALAAREARARGVWVNVADDPEASDFHVPAVLRRGALEVAVSTGGGSPATAAWVRDAVAGSLPAGTELLVELARWLREKTRGGGAGERFRALFDAGVGEDLARGDWASVDRKVEEIFGVCASTQAILRRPTGEAK